MRGIDQDLMREEFYQQAPRGKNKISAASVSLDPSTAPSKSGCGGRRVSKLYLSGRYLLCRRCLRLPYSSQYEQRWKRALRRANKLKQRLGIGVGIAEPLPDKPKGMWTRTYGSLLNEILHAEILANEARSNMFKRLVTQLEGDLE
jgi:hypothetical protein